MGMAGNESLQQPWLEWYKAKETTDGIMHYVIPVMAAGNKAPVPQKNGRLDLSKAKEFPKNITSFLEDETFEQPGKKWYIVNDNPIGNNHHVVPVMATSNLAPASQVNRRLDLSKQKVPEGGDESIC